MVQADQIRGENNQGETLMSWGPTVGERISIYYYFFFWIQCRGSYESKHRERITKGAGDKRGRRGKYKTVGTREIRTCGRERDGMGYTG